MDAWRDYPGAPADGAPVIPLADVEGATPVTIGDFGLIVVRAVDAARAFVNACPHQFLPLDHHGPRILSEDGTRLMCTVHGAQYALADGEGVAGHGLGCALDAVPVHVDAAGMVRIGAD
ncbi:MAG: nitrite reductase/ring-hydroxylating ferredoxin subunit [Paracoccaceae bacterium]|jgi:nitrite reductase/ring-hydroxylating ferredoxin subunit